MLIRLASIIAVFSGILGLWGHHAFALDDDEGDDSYVHWEGEWTQTGDGYLTGTMVITANPWDCSTCNKEDGPNSYVSTIDRMYYSYAVPKSPVIVPAAQLPASNWPRRRIARAASDLTDLAKTNVLRPSIADLQYASGDWLIFDSLRKRNKDKQQAIQDYVKSFQGKEPARANSLPYPLGSPKPRTIEDISAPRLYLAGNSIFEQSRADIFSALDTIGRRKNFGISGVHAAGAANKISQLREGDYVKPLTAPEIALAVAAKVPELKYAAMVDILERDDVPDILYEMASMDFASAPGLSSAWRVSVAGLRTAPVFYVNDIIYDLVAKRHDPKEDTSSDLAATFIYNFGTIDEPYYAPVIMVKDKNYGDPSILGHEGFHAGVKLLEIAAMDHELAARKIKFNRPSAPVGLTEAQHRARALEIRLTLRALEKLVPSQFLRQMKMTRGRRYFSSGEEFINHCFTGVLTDFVFDTGAIRTTNKEKDQWEFISNNFVLGFSREIGIPFEDSGFTPETKVAFAMLSAYIYGDTQAQSVLTKMEKLIKQESTVALTSGKAPRTIEEPRTKFGDFLLERIVPKLMRKIFGPIDKT